MGLITGMVVDKMSWFEWSSWSNYITSQPRH